MAEVLIVRNPHGDCILVMNMEGKFVSRDFRNLAKCMIEEQLNNELVHNYGFPRAIYRSLM